MNTMIFYLITFIFLLCTGVVVVLISTGVIKTHSNKNNKNKNKNNKNSNEINIEKKIDSQIIDKSPDVCESSRKYIKPLAYVNYDMKKSQFCDTILFNSSP